MKVVRRWLLVRIVWRRLMGVRCGLSKWSLERCSSLTELQAWVEEKEKEFKNQRAHMNLMKPFYLLLSESRSKGGRSTMHNEKSHTRLKY
jgi:hypothetical protein